MEQCEPLCLLIHFSFHPHASTRAPIVASIMFSGIETSFEQALHSRRSEGDPQWMSRGSLNTEIDPTRVGRIQTSWSPKGGREGHQCHRCADQICRHRKRPGWTSLQHIDSMAFLVDNYQNLQTDALSIGDNRSPHPRLFPDTNIDFGVE